MSETAYILHTATKKSLVIMDEVGRGTGTKDGLSIAWAVSEELLEHIQCRTLFATHYHELSLIKHPRMANRSMEVLDKNGGIVFLRKLKEGSSAQSYGIHVARLAGLSERVLARASRIMEDLQENEKLLNGVLPGPDSDESVPISASASADSAPVPSDMDSSAPGVSAQQVPGYSDAVFGRFSSEISSLSPDVLTPLEALMLIHKWKALFEGRSVPKALQKSKHTSPSRENSGKNTPSLFDT
jgi:DNA mismatch repair protein MutS